MHSPLVPIQIQLEKINISVNTVLSFLILCQASFAGKTCLNSRTSGDTHNAFAVSCQVFCSFQSCKSNAC